MVTVASFGTDVESYFSMSSASVTPSLILATMVRVTTLSLSTIGAPSVPVAVALTVLVASSYATVNLSLSIS